MRISDWSSDGLFRSVLAEIAGRHHRTALGADVSADVGDNVVDVDGMGDGLAHAQIVQRLDRLVQVDGAELAGLEDVDDRLFVLPRILDPALLALAVAEVQLAGGASQRSEERRVGKECVSPCRSRWSLFTENNTEKRLLEELKN